MPAIPKWSAHWASCRRIRSFLVQTVEDIAELTAKGREQSRLCDPDDDCRSMTRSAMVAALTRRFPDIIGPHREDICYATTNRQEAVKRVAPVVDALDRRRLFQFVEFAKAEGSRRALRLQARPSRPARRGRRMGICSAIFLRSASRPGASAPEILVEEIMDAFAQRFELHVEKYRRPTKVSFSRSRANCARRRQSKINTALYRIETKGALMMTASK